MLSYSRLTSLSVDVHQRLSTVWRVGYAGNTGFELSPRGGQAIGPMCAHESDFETQRFHHLSWDPSVASPFVSVFSNKEHAVLWRTQMNASTMYEIDVHGFPLLFRGAQVDEYLVLGPIPRDCVV